MSLHSGMSVGLHSQHADAKDRDSIVTSIARHYSIVQCMAELAQLQEGLRSLPDLLAFVTGARLEPAIGFDCTPSIHFPLSLVLTHVP